MTVWLCRIGKNVVICRIFYFKRVGRKKRQENFKANQGCITRVFENNGLSIKRKTTIF